MKFMHFAIHHYKPYCMSHAFAIHLYKPYSSPKKCMKGGEREKRRENWLFLLWEIYLFVIFFSDVIWKSQISGAGLHVFSYTIHQNPFELPLILPALRSLQPHNPILILAPLLLVTNCRYPKINEVETKQKIEIKTELELEKCDDVVTLHLSPFPFWFLLFEFSN